MTDKRKRISESPGHQLILELLDLIKTGKPLTPENAKTWELALSAVTIASNKNEAGQYFTRILGLKYKTGKPLGDSEITVFRIEMLKLDGMTYTEAYEKLSKLENKEYSTIKGTRDRYRKKCPEDYASILALASSQHEHGEGLVSAGFLAIYLAMVSQNR